MVIIVTGLRGVRAPRLAGLARDTVYEVARIPRHPSVVSHVTPWGAMKMLNPVCMTLAQVC